VHLRQHHLELRPQLAHALLPYLHAHPLVHLNGHDGEHGGDHDNMVMKTIHACTTQQPPPCEQAQRPRSHAGMRHGYMRLAWARCENLCTGAGTQEMERGDVCAGSAEEGGGRACTCRLVAATSSQVVPTTAAAIVPRLRKAELWQCVTAAEVTTGLQDVEQVAAADAQ
jgi:hypothetical protein